MGLLVRRIKDELEADDVELRNTDYSMVVLVGEGMRHTTGLAARAASAISRTGVDKKDETKILRELYTEFFQKSALHV